MEQIVQATPTKARVRLDVPPAEHSGSERSSAADCTVQVARSVQQQASVKQPQDDSPGAVRRTLAAACTCARALVWDVVLPSSSLSLCWDVVMLLLIAYLALLLPFAMSFGIHYVSGVRARGLQQPELEDCRLMCSVCWLSACGGRRRP
jgi:hypothetical protein